MTLRSKFKQAFRRRARVRVSWGFADQALSSLTNFALGIEVARHVSANRFGVFSVALATYLLAGGASRALNGEPLLVRFSGRLERKNVEAVEVVSHVTGSGLAVGLLAAAGLAAAACAVHTSRSVLLAFAAVVPGVLLQDMWRYCYVASGRSHRAFLSDLIWLLIMAPACVLLEVSGRVSAASLVLAWGGAGTISGLLSVILERNPPRPLRVGRWVIGQRDLSFHYLGEFVAANGALQSANYLIAAVLGLAAAGAFRGGLTLLAPVVVLFQGARLVLIPEGVRLKKGLSRRHVPRLLALGVVLAAAALGWGLALHEIPAGLGRALIGDTWDGARRLLVPLAAMEALSGIEVAALIGLRALAAADRSFRARVVEGVVTLVAAIAGVLSGSIVATAWVLVAGYVVEDVVWWWQLLIALRTPAAAARDEVEGRLAAP